MSAIEMSDEEKEFLAKCEEEFKDRFTENDQEFMKVFNAEPPTPPIVENWSVSHNAGRGRNDRRFNRRNHPYDRQRQYNRGSDNNDNRSYNRRDYGRNDRQRYY